MSLKKFMARIWDAIKNIFEGLQHEAKILLPIVTTILENMKKFQDSGVTDVLTQIIPGKLDDHINDILREKIPILLIDLKLADECLHSADQNEIIKCALKNLQLATDDARHIIIHGLASKILELISDGNFSWSDAIVLEEYYFKHVYKPVAG